MAIEIVDLSIKNGDFHSYVNVYQRVFSIKPPSYPYYGWYIPKIIHYLENLPRCHPDNP